MAAEGALGRLEGVFWRRLRERLYVWRRLFLQNWNLFKASRIGVVGLAIMIAFVILALAAPFMGLRDPVGWNAPDADLIEVDTFWTYDTTIPGNEFRTTIPISQPSGAAYRVISDTFDARTDRVYVAARNRLYALNTEPTPPPGASRNAWGTLHYISVGDLANPNRVISAPPIAMNYGDPRGGVEDYGLYFATDDGTLFFVQDDKASYPPTSDFVPRPTTLKLDGKITGLAVYNGDQLAPGSDNTHPYLVKGNPNHMWLRNGSWVRESIASVDDAGEYTSLALDGSGEVYIAYYNVQKGSPFVVIRNNGAWTEMPDLEPFSQTVNVGNFTSLRVGSDGHPRVAYYDQDSANLKYASWNGTGWTKSVVDPGPGVGRYASLALDGSDGPHIAYYDETAGQLKYASQVAGNWIVEVADPSMDTGQFASLALDNATGRPRVAYYDATARVLKYAEWAGAWTQQVVDGGPSDVGQYASLALDRTSGEPRISYYDATLRALKYASRSGAWSTETVDAAPFSDFGQYASLALNSSGVPAIAYHEALNLSLRFASWNPGTGAWELQTIASRGNIGQFASLKFDASDRPHVAFYSFLSSRTRNDVLAAGTATGKLYVIDVSIPSLQWFPRQKIVGSWLYRVRWVQDLGSEVHLATAPLRGVIPQSSPAFSADGSALFSGTAAGVLYANRTVDGSSHWGGANAGGVVVGDPSDPSHIWTSAPAVYQAAEGLEAGEEIVYAGSNRGDRNRDGLTESLLFALNESTGGPIRGWSTQPAFAAFDFRAAPVGLSAVTPDGGNLTQPNAESGTVYVGSTSGRFYAIRRDGQGSPDQASFLEPGSNRWTYVDLPLQAQRVRAEFRSAPLLLINKLVILVTSNHDNGTASPDDDNGVIYSFKFDGALSWRKSYYAVMPGTPGAWQSPRSVDVGLWVLFGGPSVTGVHNLRPTGQFLAPSAPSWVHSYKCPPPPDKMCSGYPSGNQYWLGLDSQGRDIFSQVIWGSRIALLVGFLSAFFTVVLGVVVGLIAGYVGGKTESVLMRFTDVILVLPGLPLIITLAAVLGASIWNIILVISLLGWPGIARIIRAEVLSLKERPFIDSARVTGASTTRIVFRHIAPNVMPLAFLYMTFSVSGAILTEAALSFIGLGDINTMSWGIMLQLVSQSKALTAWWWLLPPGLAITLISLAFFLVGRAFDEIVNPRLRKR